jgi:hypothetical protein
MNIANSVDELRAVVAGWRRAGGGQGGLTSNGSGVFTDLPDEPGAPSRLVLPPAEHPFWRSADVAEQTGAMFNAILDERDAASAELATTLVRARARVSGTRQSETGTGFDASLLLSWCFRRARRR